MTAIWTDIPNEDVDVDSPLTTALITALRDNGEHAKARLDALGALTAVYDFTDATDVAITGGGTPGATPWGTAQNITIPVKGLLHYTAFYRGDNSSGGNRTFAVGLRINGVDYYQSLDLNGTVSYSISGVVPNANYAIFKGGYTLAGDGAANWLDIEGYGIATGLQSVQPIIAAAVGSTLKGTAVTARMHLTILDRS